MTTSQTALAEIFSFPSSISDYPMFHGMQEEHQLLDLEKSVGDTHVVFMLPLGMSYQRMSMTELLPGFDLESPLSMTTCSSSNYSSESSARKTATIHLNSTSKKRKKFYLIFNLISSYSKC